MEVLLVGGLLVAAVMMTQKPNGPPAAKYTPPPSAVVGSIVAAARRLPPHPLAAVNERNYSSYGYITSPDTSTAYKEFMRDMTAPITIKK